MSIVLVGVNHRTAPLAVRETLAMSADRQAALLAGTRPSADVEELAILSTCNRTEIYAAGPNLGSRSGARLLIDWLASATGSSADGFRLSVYSRFGLNAVRHLARVAAGLDSMVLGEMEI